MNYNRFSRACGRYAVAHMEEACLCRRYAQASSGQARRDFERLVYEHEQAARKYQSINLKQK